MSNIREFFSMQGVGIVALLIDRLSIWRLCVKWWIGSSVVLLPLFFRYLVALSISSILILSLALFYIAALIDAPCTRSMPGCRHCISFFLSFEWIILEISDTSCSLVGRFSSFRCNGILTGTHIKLSYNVQVEFNWIIFFNWFQLNHSIV